ncbi:MAG TPA: glycerol-3-phosphate dehydrogenase, partial [Sphingorhabdus sp.]|nr:glycerol-3-phosphate dehydrogenase [Sphingorhabdus sp.]
QSLAECGQHFGHGLTEREVDYLVHHEWARTAEDILWRRGKLGLRMSQQEQLQLENHLRKVVAP